MQREGREARDGEEEGACQEIGAALGDSGSAERLFPCETFCALIPQPHKPHLCLRRRASLACLPVSLHVPLDRELCEDILPWGTPFAVLGLSRRGRDTGLFQGHSSENV